jgi:hypothetical protein
MTMPTQTAAGNGFRLSIDCPAAGWYVAPKVVPNLYSPHELCAISNRPLRQVPITSEQNTPDLSALGPSGCLIWIYYEVLGEVLGDPVTQDPERPPIPDYGRYSYPLVYSESQAFPVQLRYDWSADILWRRLGHDLAPTARRPKPAALTVMIWEGTRATADDLHAVEAMVGSVAIADD